MIWRKVSGTVDGDDDRPPEPPRPDRPQPDAARREHWLRGARRAAVQRALPDRGPAPARRRGLFGRTIQGRLAIVFAVLLLPPTAVSLWQAWDSFTEHRLRARFQVRQYAIMTATYEGKFFEDARGTLRRLATEPGVRGADPADPAACTEALGAALGRTPQFAQLALYDPEGEPICGTAEPLRSVAGKDWHAEAQEFGSFAISDYTVTPESAIPAIVVAQAVNERGGAVRGVLAATIRLHWLADFVRDIGLPSGSVFFLIDGAGSVLAGRASTPGRATTSAMSLPALPAAPDPERDRQALASAAGSDLDALLGQRSLTDFETVGDDGIRRVFSAVALPHGGVTALFGMPATTMLGWLEKDVINQMLAIAMMWFSGLIAAWLGARYLVTRWIGTLQSVAHAYGRGDYAATRNLRRAPEELADLGETLGLMACRIEDREADLRATVSQKDILLREIHHRVKNNLQIVSSLLNLRGDRVSDPAGLAAIDEIKSQVKALALVHRYLYETGDVLEVDLRAFMSELCESTLAALSQASGPVELKLEIPPFPIATDRAVPIALLTVEAMTNALKHAFPDGRAGRITVRFEPVGGAGCGRLTIADDGVGMPEEHRRGDTPAGIGLTLIDAFARQVGGRMEILGPPEIAAGTVIAVTITEGEADSASTKPNPARAA